MKLGIVIISAIFLIGCNKFLKIQQTSQTNYFSQKNIIEKRLYNWNKFIKEASEKYKVDEKLIKSIIYAESSGNPHAKSSSNAIGLMQIKPSAAGLEVYRLYGKKGQPSIQELYNPQENINIGTAYINFLEKKLTSIKNKDVMRCAIIVSYVNGMSALLKMFSKNSKQAISIINTMTVQSFYTYIKKHPAKQAFPYLTKVINIYNLV